MKYTVRYGGWIIYEGDDLDKAQEIYRGCGPYGSFWEVSE